MRDLIPGVIRPSHTRQTCVTETLVADLFIDFNYRNKYVFSEVMTSNESFKHSRKY